MVNGRYGTELVWYIWCSMACCMVWCIVGKGGVHGSGRSGRCPC